MIFCTDTHFRHEYSNNFILNQISFTKSLILPTIKNQPISKKTIEIILFSYNQQEPKSLIDKGGRQIVARKIRIML